MSKVPISTERLLSAAKKIAYQEGLSKLNIRRVADECAISVGSVYNYFSSKSDLVFAVIEDFWDCVFRDNIVCIPCQASFPCFFEKIYKRLEISLKDFESGFLRQIDILSRDEKSKGRVMEEKYWDQIKKEFQKAIRQDPNISLSVFGDTFTEDAFISFVFSNMMNMLRNRQEDCSFFKEVLIRLTSKGSSVITDEF